MKPQSQNNSSTNKPSRKRLVWIIAGLLVVIVGVVIWQVVAPFVPGGVANRAEEVARPIEQALTKSGAIKKCSSGDAGHGLNIEPWYDATYSIDANKGQATNYVIKAASDRGFQLTPATPSNKGHLKGLSDEFVDGWYFNDQVDSTYSDLTSGKVKLAMAVNVHGSDTTCNGTALTIDDSHSVVTIQVKLPATRR